jgi:hypothetical protein
MCWQKGYRETVDAVSKILVDIPKINGETMENTYENFAQLSGTLRKLVSFAYLEVVLKYKKIKLYI